MARIMVVDDDGATRELLRQALEAEGHEVEEALDGDEGLRRYRTSRPDLVLMDLLMPDCDGLTAIHEIRREFPGARILALSGGSQSRDLDLLPQAKRLGALRTLEKPVEIGRLVSEVRAAVGSCA